MARVAVVSGGTRGIGAAIGKALQTAGYTVAANYAGNDEAAAKFKAETGIAVYKWDVSNYKACAEGLTKIGHEIGPVDILVNNAGITRDIMLHKMTPEQWCEVINTNLNSLFNMTRPVIEDMRVRGFGRIVNISSINGQKGQVGQTNYTASKSGGIRLHEIPRPGKRGQGDHRQHRLSRLYRDRHGQGGSGRGFGEIGPAAHSRAPPRRTGRSRPLRGFSRVRRVRLHHRRDALRQWRAVYDLIFPRCRRNLCSE